MRQLLLHFFKYSLIMTMFAANTTYSKEVPESIYNLDSRMIGGLDVDKLTNAPLQIVKMARINVPPQEAFTLISKNIDQWVKGVKNVKWDHSQAKIKGEFSAGSSRSCSIDGDILVENVLYWEEGRIFAFNIDENKSTIFLPPTKDRANVLTVEPDDQSGSIIIWRFYYNKKFHPMALFVKNLMEFMFIDQSMENLIAINGGDNIDVDF